MLTKDIADKKLPKKGELPSIALPQAKSSSITRLKGDRNETIANLSCRHVCCYPVCG
jgi:hypothetical protein